MVRGDLEHFYTSKRGGSTLSPGCFEQGYAWIAMGARKVSIMAESLDPKDLVTLEELALSTMREHAALVLVLEGKGILTGQEVLDMIQELRRREPTA